ncbi:hypothetical protein DVJ83_09650 [Deinococcus wulumuqiensis]|uniref:Uncharacterized protein n=1 Tax=Deinococcus wulumuqiensis TaxID=980427 RepID=A0A345IKA4_9DEIO|nr:hypothetical protein [Deinococcus wulumuqiensis]AXH00127.1 hypothetical protein DVJ83_09650 [Deinococcus wulumuqiensis]
MAVPPTVTVRLRDALRHAQKRAAELGRTQQLEIGEDLFIRIGPGGRKFLLFGLGSEPTPQQAQDIAAALELRDPAYGWHQGATLRSLTVVEPGAEAAQPEEPATG